MADNVAITAGSGTSIATDDVGGVQYQRLKVTFGADGSASDVSSTNPLPVYDPDATSTGTITVTDSVVAAPAGAGALVSGSSTSGSIVSLLCPGGDAAWNVQITSLTSGTLYFEGSLDSTTGTDGNWINLNGRRTGIVNTQLAGSATANGVYRGNTSGLKYFRVRSVGALTGTPAIVIRISSGTGAVFLNASIPTGSNVLGGVDGSVLHDATDGTTAPVKIGARAISDLASATMVSAADRTDLVADLDGAQVVRQMTTIGNILRERVSNTDGASTASSTFGATASTKNCITTISCYNDSSTNGYVDIRDGTAGTILHTIPLPAKGGATLNFPLPLCTSANTALAYDVSAALTTVYLSFIGFKSKA